MRGHPYQAVWFTVSVLAFTACDQDTPTQPSGGLDPALDGPALAAALNSWRPVAPLPGSFGSGPAVGAITRSDGLSRAYVFGGTNDVGGSAPSTRVYEVATNTWRATKGSSRVAAFHLN